MPNHVTNELEFIGAPERVKELRDKCMTERSPFSLQAFCPMPEDLQGTTSPAKIVSEEELQEWLGKQKRGELSEWEKDSRPITQREQKEFRAKYGVDNWYDWRTANWGTKWDCYEHRGESDTTIMFETAWSTPIVALLKLSHQFPDVIISVRYADEDFGSNVGTYILDKGDIANIYQPEYSKESVQLAMDISGDTGYWLEERLVEDVTDEGELDEFNTWLVEIAHDEGNLIEEYPLPVLEKLLEFAVRDEQYERASAIKRLIKLKLKVD